MDVVSDILSSLRLTGGIVIDAEASGAWCMMSQFGPEHCAPFFPTPGDLIGYHYVRCGRLWAQVEGMPAAEAQAGSVLLFPRNDPHLLFSEPGREPVNANDLVTPARRGEPARIVIAGEGNKCCIHCGFLGVSAARHPLLASLPSMLVLHEDDRARGEWLSTSLRLVAKELNSNPLAVARLAELFFAEAIRRYMEQLPAGEGGWLAGLKDPAVARALTMVHSRYAEELDVDQMAREAGVSRTVLGERFVELLGEPPMKYCAHWRMRVAANLLLEGKESTANIAYAVGFHSEAAFNRAFKREYGQPPIAWKRRREEQEREARNLAAGRLPAQQVRFCTAQDGTPARLEPRRRGAGPGKDRQLDEPHRVRLEQPDLAALAS
ncbi:cupin domain-containing protein [Sphingomonas sp. GCM10030256]|uniref:AraC family transcriptional regulator n=1 Tax=Sphingomonas sp. GCM10030256 TaxID=3273427 RepID=UPI00360C2399